MEINNNADVQKAQLANAQGTTGAAAGEIQEDWAGGKIFQSDELDKTIQEMLGSSDIDLPDNVDTNLLAKLLKELFGKVAEAVIKALSNKPDTKNPNAIKDEVRTATKQILDKKLDDIIKSSAKHKFTGNTIAQTATSTTDSDGNKIGVITYIAPSSDLSYTKEQFAEFHYDDKVKKDASDPMFEKVTYDSQGRMQTKTIYRRDGATQEVKYSYDSNGKVTEKKRRRN